MTAPTHNEATPTGPIIDIHDPRLQAAVATGLISGILFVIRLTTHTDVPSWVSGLLATAVPAGVAWVFAHIALLKTPPGAGKHESHGTQGGGA